MPLRSTEAARGTLQGTLLGLAQKLSETPEPVQPRLTPSDTPESLRTGSPCLPPESARHGKMNPYA